MIKNLILLYLFLISANAFALVGDDNNGSSRSKVASPTRVTPNIDRISINDKALADTHLIKAQYQKPLLDINPYLGDVQISFSLPFFANLNSLKEIKFFYQSSRSRNIGWGNGFSVNLPELEITPRKLSVGANELLAFDSSRIPLKRLGLVATKLKLKFNNLKAYKNQDLNDQAIYVSANSELGTTYLQIKTDGETNIFNQYGQVTAILNMFNIGLFFEYSEGYLTRISQDGSDAQLVVLYKQLDQEKKWMNGSFAPAKIASAINISDKRKTYVYKMTSSGEYLEQVQKEGAHNFLFKGKYTTINKVNSTRNQNVGMSKKLIVVYGADLNSPTFIGPQDDIIYVDINNDLYTDKIVTNFDAYKKFLEKLMKEQRFHCDNYSCRTIEGLGESYTRVYNFEITYKTFIAIKENDQINYKEDATQSFSLPVAEVLDVKMEWRKAKSTDYLSPVVTPLKSLRLLDLFNAGKKDFIFCGYETAADSGQEVLDYSVYVGEKQSALATNVKNLYLNGKTPFFDNHGSVAMYFENAHNKEKLLELSQKSGALRGDALVGTSVLKRKNLSAKCNQYSVFSDFNKDGQIDILTGDELQYLNPNGELQSEILSTDQLKKIFVTNKDFDTTKYPISFIDFYNTGEFSPVAAFGTSINPQTKELEVFTVDASRLYKRLPKVDLLTNAYTANGGEVATEYEYLEGTYIAKKLIYKPNFDQRSYFRKFDFQGAKFLEDDNLLLGFEKVQITKGFVGLDGRSEEIKTKEDLIFDRDQSALPNYFFNRARANGRVLSQKIASLDNNKTDKLVRNQYRDLIFPGGFGLSYLLQKTESVTGEGVTKTNIDFKKINNFLIPLTYTQITNDNEIKENVEFILDEENYRLQKHVISQVDDNGKNLSPDVVMTYDKSRGDIVQISTGEVQENFEYDSQGRVKRINHTKTGRQEFTYQGQTELLASANINGLIESFEYDSLISKPISYQKINSTPINVAWNADGAMSKLSKSQVVFYKINTQDKNIIEYSLADEVFRLTFDGFGRLIKKEKRINDAWVSLSSMQFDFDDKPIKEVQFNIFDNKNVITTFSYDSLGRNIDLNKSSNGNSVLEQRSTVYSLKNDQGITSSTFFDQTSTEVKDKNRGILEQSSPIEIVKYQRDEIGKILNATGEVSDIDYGYDENNQLTSSLAKKTIDEGVKWNIYQREIDVNGKFINYQNGTKEFFDFGSHPIAKKINEFNLIDNTWHFDQLVQSKTNLDNLAITTSYVYNNENLLSTMSTMSSTINLDKKFTYDQFERVKNEMIKIGDKVIDLETNFKDGKLDSLKPFVTSTNINLHGKLQGYQLSNGMKFQIEYDYLGRLRNIEAITLNGRINSSFKRDQYGRLEQVNSTVLPENNYMYMADTRLDLEEAKINLTSVKRDADSRVIELKASNLLFKWQGHTLESVKFKGVNYKQHYGIDEQYIGTCKENATSTKDCVLKISDDEFLVEGIYFKKIIISGVIVGILVNDQFYPAILDHNGAVVGLYKVDGSGIEFLRSFNAFGVKESVSGNKKLESLMPFTFGHLIQVSFFNGELLQSQTRAYLPSTGEWASVDAYALWNPNELEKNVGNWNAIEYASGDPVNKLDVSGHVVVVNARELNFGGSLGKIGAHTYTEVRRDNGEVFQVMGSGHPGSKLEVKVGANIDHQNGFDNVASIEIKSPNGISQDDWDKKVIEAGNNVKNDWDGKLDYSILGGNRETGANCHGVTREVLDRAGGQAKQLDNFNPLGLNPGLNR